MTVRKMTEADNPAIARIIRENLERYGLDLPGTAYCDPELDSLCAYYDKFPKKRKYLVLEEDGAVAGGVGLAETGLQEDCAELQKLYLAEPYKGRGLGKVLMKQIEEEARRLGYRKLYLETHTKLREACCLYRACGFRQIEKPEEVNHGLMNCFFIKDL